MMKHNRSQIFSATASSWERKKPLRKQLPKQMKSQVRMDHDTCLDMDAE